MDAVKLHVEQLVEEVELLKRLKHNNIVRYLVRCNEGSGFCATRSIHTGWSGK